MSYLLDTNVVSEMRKATPDSNLLTWLAPVSGSELYISVLVIGEIRQGIDRLQRRDAAQATLLWRWLSELRAQFADRILPITSEIAEQWGRLNVPNPVPVVDGLLAATAIVRGLTLVARNTRHVESTGARLLNPFLPRV